MKNCLTRWFHTGLIFWGIIASVWGVAASAPAMQISVTPSAPTVGEPVTFTATGCSGCYDYVWQIGSVGGGQGYQITQTFQDADTYTVQVQAIQQVCMYDPYYYCWEEYRSATKQVEVKANEFTVNVIPTAGCTVMAGDGGVDTVEAPNGIVCSGGMDEDDPLCTEQFENSQIASLKVVPESGYAFTGWTVNGAQITLTSAELLFLTTMPVLAGLTDLLPPGTTEANVESGCEQQTVYLTFDDGPLPGTDDVIRILREEGSKGTFFMVGVHNISTWRSEQIRDAEQYFEVGNHSYSHPWTTEDVTAYYTGPPEVVLYDFQDNDTELSNTLNLSPVQQFVQARLPTKNTWRIPGIPPITDGTGGAAADLLHDPNGYNIYGWDVLWEREGVHPRETPDDMAEIVEKALTSQSTQKRNKIIVLMHDDMFKQSEGDDIKLRQFVQILKDKGYRFDYISNY